MHFASRWGPGSLSRTAATRSLVRHWILFFHIIAVIIWMGGSIYVEALMAAVGRSNDESGLVGVFRKVGATNRRLFNIAGVATIVFGFWLVFIVPGSVTIVFHLVSSRSPCAVFVSPSSTGACPIAETAS